MFTDTSTKLARDAGVTPALVRLYADLGFLEHIRLDSGARLFPPGQAGRVREILAQRLRNRGRKSAA